MKGIRGSEKRQKQRKKVGIFVGKREKEKRRTGAYFVSYLGKGIQGTRFRMRNIVLVRL